MHDLSCIAKKSDIFGESKPPPIGDLKRAGPTPNLPTKPNATAFLAGSYELVVSLNQSGTDEMVCSRKGLTV